MQKLRKPRLVHKSVFVSCIPFRVPQWPLTKTFKTKHRRLSPTLFLLTSPLFRRCWLWQRQNYHSHWFTTTAVFAVCSASATGSWPTRACRCVGGATSQLSGWHYWHGNCNASGFSCEPVWRLWSSTKHELSLPYCLVCHAIPCRLNVASKICTLVHRSSQDELNRTKMDSKFAAASVSVQKSFFVIISTTVSHSMSLMNYIFGPLIPILHHICSYALIYLTVKQKAPKYNDYFI